MEIVLKEEFMKALKRLFAIILLIIAVVLSFSGVHTIIGVPLGLIGVYLMREAGIDN